jgi:carbon monoxide dehydrogenase subunit G
MDVRRLVLQKPDLIVVKVRGKAPGSAMDLEGRMRLTAVDESRTNMHWEAQVAVSGILASVGTHLINNIAEKLTRQFFTCLKSHLQATQEKPLPP